jgi:uncharacterized protein YdeI (YjbR/CyaY-like superfamily)
MARCMIESDRFEQVVVESVEVLRAWLTNNHASDASVWLVTYKKVVQDKYVSRAEVLDELLCFGWIDGIMRKVDDQRVMQLISRRRVQHWAQSYKECAARLIAENRMHPAGLAAIEQSKREGLWDAMADVDALVVPDDLANALAAVPSARARFDGFAPSYRRNVLRWIKLAKMQPTRAKRIALTVETATRNMKIAQM